jgi:hypothetical protein
VVLAWTFDLTEAGIHRTPDTVAPRGGPHATAAVPTVARSSETPNPPTAPPKGEARLDPLVVAVLPFENLSGSAEAEPFVLGLHDDLITELSRASALTVISRTSVRG